MSELSIVLTVLSLFFAVPALVFAAFRHTPGVVAAVCASFFVALLIMALTGCN